MSTVGVDVAVGGDDLDAGGFSAYSTTPARASESRGEMISTSMPCAIISSTWPDWVAGVALTVGHGDLHLGNHLAASSGICWDDVAPYGNEVALHETPTAAFDGCRVRRSSSSCAVHSSPQ